MAVGGCADGGWRMADGGWRRATARGGCGHLRKPPTAKPPTAKPPTAKPRTAKPPSAKPPTGAAPLPQGTSPCKVLANETSQVHPPRPHGSHEPVLAADQVLALSSLGARCACRVSRSGR